MVLVQVVPFSDDSVNSPYLLVSPAVVLVATEYSSITFNYSEIVALGGHFAVLILAWLAIRQSCLGKADALLGRIPMARRPRKWQLPDWLVKATTAGH